MADLKRLGLLLWGALGLYLVLVFVQGPLATSLAGRRPGAFAGGWLGVVEALLGLAVLIGLFVLVPLALRALPAWMARHPAPARPAPAPAGPAAGEAFPSPLTVAVAAWLLFVAAFNVAGLLLTLSPPAWLTDAFPALAVPTVEARPAAGAAEGAEETAGGTAEVPDESPARPIRDLIVTLFAAGVGSTIATMMGYLEHACVKKDFDPAFAPWYVGRPIMGLLLGALFYFVLKGGLLATVSGADENGAMALNEYALAGLGGLVGLFSKNALEKLREVFDIFFATRIQVAREAAADLVNRLPAELRRQVQPFLAPAGAAGEPAGGGEAAADEEETPPRPPTA
jgi:hypothetical protein